MTKFQTVKHLTLNVDIGSRSWLNTSLIVNQNVLWGCLDELFKVSATAGVIVSPG